MTLKGKHLIIPFLDACFRSHDDMELCPGCSIVKLSDDHINKLNANKRVSGYYKRSIESLSIGLCFTPSDIFTGQQLRFIDILKLAIFSGMVVRLTTGIPIDVPFWLDVSDDGRLLDYERTLVRTYRNGPKYSYPIDEGKAYERASLLEGRLQQLLSIANLEKDKNRLIRAIEFASVGFQTYHVPTRLVNLVTFLETLFSTSRNEITFQLASRVSWYLRFKSEPEEREEIFNSVKSIYNARSQVVHGENINKPKVSAKTVIDNAEEINTTIFCCILENDHIDQFSMSEKRRSKQFQKLSLGLPSDFYK